MKFRLGIAPKPAIVHNAAVRTTTKDGCLQFSCGGCWRSRCQPVGDGDAKDTALCERPVRVSPSLHIPQCMEMISADDVIRRIEFYYEGGALAYLDEPARPA